MNIRGEFEFDDKQLAEALRVFIWHVYKINGKDCEVSQLPNTNGGVTRLAYTVERGKPEGPNDS